MSTPAKIVLITAVICISLTIGFYKGEKRGERMAQPVEAFKERAYLKDGRWFDVIFIKQGNGKILHFFFKFKRMKYRPDKAFARKYAKEIEDAHRSHNDMFD